MNYMFLLWSLLAVCSYIANAQLLNASYCYGDNSGGSNLVDVVCSPDVVHVVAIITASKNVSEGCPAEQHVYSADLKGQCCTMDDSDCFGLFDGDISRYLTCNGELACQRLPVVRTWTDASCASSDYPAFSNYMVFQYRCVEPYNLHGACNTTDQCFDPYAVCDNSLCVCGPNTTEQNNQCYRDGTPGGKCNEAISCLGHNVTCIKSVCTCDLGFSGAQETCIEDGSLGGQCSDTIPCTDDKAVCSPEGLCECVSGYEERNSACVKEDYYLINGTYCYGDSSHGDNLVNVSCGAGVIYLYDIIAGSKPISRGCPAEDHIYSAAEYTTCCTFDADDCLTPYTGDWSSYRTCNGRRDCYGVPVIRMETDPLCNATKAANYKRYSNYMIFRFYCVPDYRLHGACNTTEQCTDENAECNKNVCLCGHGYSEIDDSCIQDGSIGGICNATIPCTDDNAECSDDGICGCKASFSQIGDICIEDGKPGGNCIQGACTDVNAECSVAGRCECITDFAEVNGTCKEDGSVGGKCDANNTCAGDNTECNNSPSLDCGRLSCDPGVCFCINGYSANTDGVCVEDGTIGGRCSDTIACADGDAVCSSGGVCECKAGHSEIGGVCIKDGLVGGFCNRSIPCEDSNSTCSSGNVCECDAGYSVRNYVCIPDGTVGGKCKSGSQCTQANTVCSNDGTCVCVQDYSEVNRICQKDGDILGKCKTDGSCEDANTVCDASSGLACGVDVCDPGVCTCVSNYSLNTEGTCIEDGSIGGKCSPTISCEDGNATCSAADVCECKSGFTEHNGECVGDGEIGGACTTDADCFDASAGCSAGGICVCDAGFSEVSRVCQQDGAVDGVCDENSGCSGDFTTCDTNTNVQCGAATCSPGICTCQAGYNVVKDSGVCVKDGDLGGKCGSDTDCNDGNAECDAQTKVCVCPTGFTEIDGACIQDGTPDGVCLGTGSTCLDSHSVCVAGVCRCNSVRNYSNQGGTCVRDDGYVHGDCGQAAADCVDDNAQCTTDGVCECLPSYGQVNGECKKDEIPTVTSCEGDDPYNALQPDCPQGSKAIVLREVTMVKPASSQCPGTLDTYNGATFRACCMPGAGDCEVVTDIATDCDPSVEYLSETNYRKLEYICINQNDSVAVDDDGDGVGSPAYLTSPNYPGSDTSGQSEQSCSVQATCQSNIDVFLLLNELIEVGRVCRQSLEITEGSGTTTFTCSDAAGATRIYASTGGYFIVKLVNTHPSARGKFVLKFEAQISTANVTVSCGNRLDATPDELGPCDPEQGSLGGACSATSPCIVPNSVCVENVCECASGYVQSDDECSSAGGGGDAGGGTPIGLIAGIVGGVLALMATAAVLFRKRIRKKLCPEKTDKKPLEDAVVPITHAPVGPAPMNVKFPGRPDPLQVDKRKTLPPLTSNPDEPFVDYLYKEQGEELKMRNTLNGVFPAPRQGEDSVVRTKFSRSSSSAVLLATPTANGLSQSMNTRAPDTAPDTQTPEQKDTEKKKKKKKRKKARESLKRARVGISSIKAFESPLRGKEGIYRRIPDVGSHPAPAPGTHPPPAPPGTVVNPFPPFPPNINSSPHPPPDLRNAPVQSFNRPNPLSRSLGGGTVNPRLPASFPGPAQATGWQQASIAATQSSRSPFIRRPSVLDITMVNDPASIETTKLEC